MKFSRDLSNFIMTVAAAAGVFFFCFYIVFITHPEHSSKLISCGISVAIFLFVAIFVALRSFSRSANAEAEYRELDCTKK